MQTLARDVRFKICTITLILCSGAAVAAAAVEADPSEPIIIPLHDNVREVVIIPHAAASKRPSWSRQHFYEDCWELFQGRRPPEPEQAVLRGTPLSKSAAVSVRPITFVPAKDLRPLVPILLTTDERWADAWLKPMGGPTAKFAVASVVNGLLHGTAPPPSFATVLRDCRISASFLEESLVGEMPGIFYGLIGSPLAPLDFVEPLRRTVDADLRGYAETNPREAVYLQLSRWRGRAKALAPILARYVPHARPAQFLSIARAIRCIGPHAGDAVPALCAKLRSAPQTVVRDEAVLALAVIGKAAIPSLRETLLEILHSGPPPEAQAQALRALVTIGCDAESLAPTLGVMLSSNDVSVRREALEAVARIGPPAAPLADGVMGCLGHKEWSQPALAALAAIGGKHAVAALDQVTPLLRANPHDTFLIRRVQDVIAAAGPEAASAVPVLRELLKSQPPPADNTIFPVAEGAAQALAAIGKPAKEAVPDMAARLRGTCFAADMASIDADAALAALRANAENHPASNAYDLRQHAIRWLVDLDTQAFPRMRDWLLEGRAIDFESRIGGGDRDRAHFMRLMVGFHHPTRKWSDTIARSHALRRGDSYKRVVLLLGPPARIADHALEYRERDHVVFPRVFFPVETGQPVIPPPFPRRRLLIRFDADRVSSIEYPAPLFAE